MGVSGKPQFAFAGFCTLALCAFSLASAQTCSSRLLSVESQGFAGVVGGEAGAARDEAIRDGLRAAVETALGVVVESSTLVVDSQLVTDEVRTRASGFVQSYVVTGETIDQNSVRVDLVSCVDRRELRAGLESFGLILREQLGNPRLLINTARTSNPVIARALQEKLYRHFVEIGFDVRRAEATGCGQNGEIKGVADVDVVVCAGADVTTDELDFRSSLFSSRASLDLAAELANTGQVVANLQSSSPPQVSSVRAASEDAALTAALDNVTDRFVNRLVKELNASADRNAALNIVFSGLPSYGAFSELESFVEAMRGVEAVGQQRFRYSQGAFSVHGSVLANDVARRLESYPGLTLRITKVDAFAVEVKVEK